MDDPIVIIVGAIQQANLTLPQVEPGVPRDPSYINEGDRAHFAEAALQALYAAGYEVRKKSA